MSHVFFLLQMIEQVRKYFPIFTLLDPLNKEKVNVPDDVPFLYQYKTWLPLVEN